jgi:hypothetical protein
VAKHDPDGAGQSFGAVHDPDGLGLDDEELFCLLFLGLDKKARLAQAMAGILPHDGSSARLAAKGLCVQIAVDPRAHRGTPGEFLATDRHGGLAIVELTARGREALFVLGSTRRPAIG